MRVGGYDFPEITLNLAVGALRFPAIYQPEKNPYNNITSYGFAVDQSLLPAEVVADLFKVGKSGLVRIKSGSAPIVKCADMPWLVSQLAATQASNRPPDHVFFTNAVRAAMSPIPLRWIAGVRRDTPDQSEDRHVTLLLDALEVIKPQAPIVYSAT